MSAPAAIAALLNRARTGMLFAAASDVPPKVFDFWQGYAKALKDLCSGAGEKLAAKDAKLGGYEPPGFLQAAWPRLAVDVESLTVAEVKQRLRAEGVEITSDPVSLGEIEAVQQIERGIVATVDLHDELAPSGVDAGDGSGEHGLLLVFGGGLDIVAQEGGAA